MSTVISYHHSMEDVHSKNLPSLAQIMPMNSIGSNSPASSVGHLTNANVTNTSSGVPTVQSSSSGSNAPATSYPTGSGNGGNAPLSPSLLLMAPSFDQEVYQSAFASSPEIFSSNSSTASTTPASSFSSQGSGSNNEEKCTCRSNANKIPRPRNAFILFRQKYHQAVLDEGGVIRTNPEVSRELGRRWRALSAEEKEHWNNLAEEEKKNHAKKYPGYRYAPRRNGKNKSCPACRKKALKQQQAHVLNQQMVQLQQDQYQYYPQSQSQQSQPNPSYQLHNQQIFQFPQEQYQYYQQPPPHGQVHQSSPQYGGAPSNQSLLSAGPQARQKQHQSVPQIVFSNPYSFSAHQQYNVDVTGQDRVGPLPIQGGQELNNNGQYGNYDTNLQGGSSVPTTSMAAPLQPGQVQRYGSLPAPVSANYGFDVFNSQS